MFFLYLFLNGQRFLSKILEKKRDLRERVIRESNADVELKTGSDGASGDDFDLRPTAEAPTYSDSQNYVYSGKFFLSGPLWQGKRRGKNLFDLN